MKPLAIVPIALAALAVMLAPALAKTKKQRLAPQPNYAEPYHQYPGATGWRTREVSDPSFGDRAGINAARRSGRCVVDLGYGRYEYCGW